MPTREEFLDTPRGSFELQRLMDRPCRYARAFRVTPSCVYDIDMGSLSGVGPKGIRQGSFDSAELNRLFKDDNLAHETLVIVPKYPDGTYDRCTLAPYADVAEPFEMGASPAELGAAIASLSLTFGRTRVVCATLATDFSHGAFRNDLHGLYESSIRNLSRAGCIVYRYDEARRLRDGASDAPALAIDWDLVDEASTYDNDMARWSYLAAVRTLAASNFEFVYQLMTAGSAVTNTTLQRVSANSVVARTTSELDRILRAAQAASPALPNAPLAWPEGEGPNLFATHALFALAPAEAVDHGLFWDQAQFDELNAWWRVLVESRRVRDLVMDERCRMRRVRTTDPSECFERVYDYIDTHMS